ncbi:MAG: F0F1 ATP synthase subunit delta [Magnetococcales bacterium]|nr:F0F1 ATP synthase subunit delta [Magnetococcales bacterium]
MAELATVARPYSKAAFAAAEASGKLVEWSQALTALAEVASHEGIRRALGNPHLSATQRVTLLTSLISVNLSTEANYFLRMLVDAKKIALLPAISAQFEALKNEREQMVEATVYSALPVADKQLKTLTQRLTKKFGRSVQVQVVVDAALIGGVKVVVGDQVMNGSVQAKLEALYASLTA